MRNLDTWRALRAPFLTGLALSAALMLLPLTALGEAGTAAQPDTEVLTLPAAPTPAAQPTPAPGEWDSAQSLRVLQTDGTVAEMTMADYLWAVVAAEMPASFEPEALRAQAVCARTYSLWKMQAGSHGSDGADICADSSCCQAYISPQRWAASSGEIYA